MLKTHKKTTLFIALSAVSLLLVSVIASQTASASSYNGANLISNGAFRNDSTMSRSQIQSFLSSKNSGLATRSFKLDCYGSDSKEREWYTAIGAPCDQTIPAADIIYYASRIYGVNPQAVLVTLQKEQSLITTANPTSWQLNNAMGYGCPTTGTCASTGFYRQIDHGVWVLRYHYERARGNTTWWNNNSNWTCGTEKNFYKPSLYPNSNTRFYDGNGVHYRTHNLANAATSAMYCYTPHAYNNPNGLHGLPKYGTKGQYYTGSYNFVRFFGIWFDPYAAKVVDRTGHPRTGSNSVVPGQKFTNTIRMQNTGNVAWYDESGLSGAPSGTKQVMLATDRSFQRKSSFGKDWGGCKCRPARDFTNVYEEDGATLASNQHRALPSQIVEWEIEFTAPSQPGKYREWIRAFVFKNSGLLKMSDKGFFDIEVKNLTYEATINSRTGHPRTGNDAVLTGQSFTNKFRFKNTGTATWYDEAGLSGAPSGTKQVMLATQRSFQRQSQFANDWGGCKCRPARNFTAVFESNGTTMAGNQNRALPGQIVEWEIEFTAPSQPGKYREWIEPFLFRDSGRMKVSDKGFFDIEVKPATYSALVVSRTGHPRLGSDAVNRGQTFSNTIRMKNTGNVAWYDEAGLSGAPAGTMQVMLATDRPFQRQSQFGSEWGSCKCRPARNFTAVYESNGSTLASNQHRVLPGQIAEWEVQLKAPNTTGTYREWIKAFVFKDSGLLKMSDKGFFDIEVKP